MEILQNSTQEVTTVGYVFYQLPPDGEHCIISSHFDLIINSWTVHRHRCQQQHQRQQHQQQRQIMIIKAHFGIAKWAKKFIVFFSLEYTPDKMSVIAYFGLTIHYTAVMSDGKVKYFQYI